MFTYDELWQLQTAYYDSVMYPENLKQIKAINSTIFAEDVSLRPQVQ